MCLNVETDSTARELKSILPYSAALIVLTGPVARGDAGTVRAHLEALGALRDPGAGEPLGDVVEGYRAMAAATVERRAATGRLDPARAAALRDALGGGEP